MGAEYSSGIKFDKGDRIKGYEIVNVFEPGSMAFSGKAKAPNGRPVFFKKYVCPGGSSPWLAGFVSYQSELKQKIQGNPASKGLCYEFIEFFEMSKTGGMVPLRAFYQVFEWVEGGSDLRKMLDTAKANPSSYSWSQKVTFARVMMAGVNAIHRSGVIHTDLKPNNLYLIPDTSLGAKYKLRIIDMDYSTVKKRHGTAMKDMWVRLATCRQSTC
jgi:serine/threonine protein kinase